MYRAPFQPPRIGRHNLAVGEEALDLQRSFRADTGEEKIQTVCDFGHTIAKVILNRPSFDLPACEVKRDASTFVVCSQTADQADLHRSVPRAVHMLLTTQLQLLRLHDEAFKDILHL